jgi:hypothetical protein
MSTSKRIQSLQETLQEGAAQAKYNNRLNNSISNQASSNWQDEMKDSQHLLVLLRDILQKQGHAYLAQELISVRRDFNRLICFFTNAASAARLKMLSSQLLSHIKHEHFVQIDTKIAPSLQAPYKPENPRKTLSKTIKKSMEERLVKIESPQIQQLFLKILKREGT